MTARQQINRCSSGKVRYRNRKAAAAGLQRSQQRQHNHGAPSLPQGYYRCPECRGWHLTRYPLVKRNTPPNNSG